MTKQQKMKQQNVGQDCNILLHVLGSKIQTAKISTLKKLWGFLKGRTPPYKQEDNMSLFRKKKWDIERSEQNKGLIRQLFSQAMPDGDTWKIVYGYGLNIKTSDYIIARKTTYTYTSLIIGYRESDMSIALLQTTPELEGCSEAEIFTRDSIKKAKISTGMYTIYHQGGIIAGYHIKRRFVENEVGQRFYFDFYGAKWLAFANGPGNI